MAENSGEIARAWVSIIPSFQGAQQEIAEELGGVGEPAGKRASKGFLGGIGGIAGKAAKVTAGAVGVIGGAVAGIAIKGGIDRALNIEDAQSKLSGLGHDTKSVEKIMDNALGAVKGTAFGLGDAATVAASAVAAGVKPGTDLERTLTLVGDTAAIAGTDMDRMGAIFNKVAASNKVQMDSINQLHNAGVPALQLLADELGVTAEEASKMASSGQIDFETFQNAMEEGMGGAAQKTGETFRGAMANTKAALGRVGATIMTPLLDSMTEGAGGIIPVIDKVNDAIAPLAESFGEWLSDIDIAGALDTIGDSFGGIWDVVGPLFSQLSESFGPLIPQIIELTTAFSPVKLLFTALEPLLPLIVDLISQLAGTIGVLLEAIMPIVDSLMEFLMPLLTELFSAILPPVIEIVTGLVAALEPLIEALGPILTGVLEALMPLVETVFGLITTSITTSLDMVMGIVNAFTALFRGDWSTFWDEIGGIFTSLWDGVKDFATQFFSDLPGDILGALGDLGSLLVDAGANIISGLWEGLKAGWDKVMGWFGGLGSWIADNKGPKAYDLALLVPAGGWIMDGLNKGLQDSMPELGATLDDVAWMIAHGIDPNTTASAELRAANQTPVPSGQGSGSVSAGGGGISVTQEIHANDTEEIIQEANGRMFQTLREAGVL